MILDPTNNISIELNRTVGPSSDKQANSVSNALEDSEDKANYRSELVSLYEL